MSEGIEAPAATSHRAAFGDRSLFPGLSAQVYLNHAAISPASVAVHEQVSAVLSDYAEGGLEGFLRWLPQRERLKGKLATLIGATAEDIGFVANTTAGMVAIAFSLDWKPNDRVLLFEGDFPTNVTPWQQAAKTFGATVDFVSAQPFERSTEEGLAALEEELRKGARIVAVSQVRFQSGFAMPVDAIGALCHRYGAELSVDAIQGLGVVPLDVGNIDYLSCGSHKWLMGLEGAGFVYIAPKQAQALRPRLAGWLGHENALDFLFLGPGHLRHDRPFRKSADVVEQGAQNTAGLAALEASVDLIGQLGVCAIWEHVQRYHDALEPLLLEKGFESRRASFASGRSGSLSVRPTGKLGELAVAELAEQLGQAGVAVTTPDGHLRFAPHWPNALDEVAIIAEALGRL